jgi:O-antigen/teichoic acid export membrane protein
MSGLGLVSVGVSTRYLGPSSWGQLATATAVTGIVASFTDLGLWTIGAREISRRPLEADRVLGAILTIGLVVSIFGGLVGLAVAFGLYGGADEELPRTAILLLLLTVPLSAPFGAIGAYFMAQQKAWVGALAALSGSVVTLALVVAAVLLDLGFVGVVSAYVVAAVAQAVVLGAFAWGKVRLRPSLDLALCRELTRWVLPVGGGLVVHSIYWRIDIVLLSLLSSASNVAVYALAFKIIDVVMALPNYLHVTVMPELARTARTERFHEIMAKTFTALVVGAMAVAVLFAAFADELTVLAGGEAFQDAASVVQILTLAVALAYIGSMFGDAFLVHDKLNVGLRISLCVLPANIALNVLLIPIWGARGAALAWVAGELMVVCAYGYMYRRFFGRLPHMHKAPQVLAAACAMGAFTLIKLLPPASGASPVLVLTVGGALSLVVYVAALYGLKAMPRELHVNLVVPITTWLRAPMKARG